MKPTIFLLTVSLLTVAAIAQPAFAYTYDTEKMNEYLDEKWDTEMQCPHVPQVNNYNTILDYLAAQQIYRYAHNAGCTQSENLELNAKLAVSDAIARMKNASYHEGHSGQEYKSGFAAIDVSSAKPEILNLDGKLDQSLFSALQESNPDGFWMSFKTQTEYGTIYERGWFVQHNEHTLFASYVISEKERVMFVVDEVSLLHDQYPETAFETINNMLSTDSNYPFVLDRRSLETLSHGSNVSLVGTIVDVWHNASDPYLTIILKVNEKSKGTWVGYEFFNPETEMTESKKTFLKLHNGYVFASGMYVDEYGKHGDDYGDTDQNESGTD